MAKTYEVTLSVRVVNRLMKFLMHLGLGPRNTYLLTVQGRKTGRPYSTPVSLVEQDGQRWLVSPYGEVGWVRNARAAGEVALSRAGRSETVKLEAQGPEASAPVLKAYLAHEPITRPYFDARPDSPLEDFAAEAARHPVFLLHPAEG